MAHLILKDPIWLFALVALPLLVWLRGRRRVSVLLVPFAAAWHRPSLIAPSRWPVALALAGLALLIGALARPQRIEDKREVRTEGYDIMLCVDVSGSMRWEDHDRPGTGPNRIQTIKPIIQNFVEQRTHDRIGVVLFGRQAFTLSPLTFDHDWIERQLARVEIGMVNANGTAIGDGLGTALNRLAQEKRTEAGRRRGAFVVLMTDGGESIVDGRPLSSLVPLDAAQIAKAKNIPVYCIGVGRPGFAWEVNPLTGYATRRPSDLDEGLLYEIANNTGGRFFRAEDKDTTEKAFKAIDRAQKIEFQAKSYLVTTELFWWLAAPGLGVFALGAALARPAWKREAVAA